MEKKVSNPAGLASPGGRFSHVVKITSPKTLVFIAGQTASDSSGNVVGKDNFAEQAEQVFKNIEVALASENLTFADVVKVNMYLTDMKYRPQLHEARSRYIKGVPPASTLVSITGLAHPDYMLEIEVVAASDQ